MGERTVMEMEVMGKRLGLGLPASMDIMPGTFSRGRRPLTNWIYYQYGRKGTQTAPKLTRAGETSLRVER
jgi:hypothetical protein